MFDLTGKCALVTGASGGLEKPLRSRYTRKGRASLFRVPGGKAR